MPMRPPIHRPIGDRPGRAPAYRSAAFYHTAAWQRMCELVLERDQRLCRIGLPGCLGAARIVDHIKERGDGGSDEPSNLRAVCWPCHNRRHKRRK